jgi:hypothetical protein
MAAIGAAVSAGLAVAPLANSIAPVGTFDVGHRYGLPRLPDSDVILHSQLLIRSLKRRLRCWLLLSGADMQMCPPEEQGNIVHPSIL